MTKPNHHYELDDDREETQDPAAARMGFLDHLEELRTRLVRSLIAIAVGVVIAFSFVDRVADFVLAPAYRMLPPGSTLIFTKPGEALAFNLDIALIAGFVLAAPVVMYQVWRSPRCGLYANEKRFAVPFVVLTTIGTLAGAAFSHYVMFSAMIAFLGTFGSAHVKFMPSVENTFDLYKTLLIGMVVVFQIPTVVFFLAKMRVVTARLLWRYIKYAILAIFIVAAVLTPSTDPWNQTVFAMPMIALYVISIGIAWLAAPKDGSGPPDHEETKLRLVIGAMVINQARRQVGARRRAPGAA